MPRLFNKSQKRENDYIRKLCKNNNPILTKNDNFKLTNAQARKALKNHYMCDKSYDELTVDEKYDKYQNDLCNKASTIFKDINNNYIEEPYTSQYLQNSDYSTSDIENVDDGRLCIKQDNILYELDKNANWKNQTNHLNIDKSIHKTLKVLF